VGRQSRKKEGRTERGGGVAAGGSWRNRNQGALPGEPTKGLVVGLCLCSLEGGGGRGRKGRAAGVGGLGGEKSQTDHQGILKRERKIPKLSNRIVDKCKTAVGLNKLNAIKREA